MPGTGHGRGGSDQGEPRRRPRERETSQRPDAHGGASRRSHSEEGGEEPRRPKASRRRGVDARAAARHAALYVRELTGEQPEGVTSLERGEDGWQVGIEVVETHRIPDSTDILAEYRVEVDEEGGLVSYHRERRYYRGRADER
jgi:hypothetical protein